MALSIALQLYSVRHEMKTDLPATLKKVKAMGYDGVEFAGTFGYDPAALRALCAEIGLVPISAHVPVADMMENAEGTFQKYATIGTRFVAIPYLTEEYRPGAEKFGEMLEMMKTFGTVAKKHGIQLLYHNHDFEFAKLSDGTYGLDRIYAEVSADLLQTELDTCWVNVGGEDPANFVRKYAGRAPVVHLKDFVGEKSAHMYELIGIKSENADKQPEAFAFRPVGLGKQDFPAILTAAKDAGAEWVVVEQDTPTMGLSELESAEKSIQYLKSLNW